MKYFLTAILTIVSAYAMAQAQQQCAPDYPVISCGKRDVGYVMNNQSCCESNNYCGTGQPFVFAHNGNWVYRKGCYICGYFNGYCRTNNIDGPSYGISGGGQIFLGRVITGTYVTAAADPQVSVSPAVQPAPYAYNPLFIDSLCQKRYTKKKAPPITQHNGLFGYYVKSCFCSYQNYFCGTPANPGPSFNIPVPQ